MAFELTPDNRTNGLEADATKTQCTLQFFASLSTPTTEAVMRTAAELGQSAPYSNEGWLAVMAQLANVSLVESSLTAQERSVYNVIRSVVTPDPSLDCCGADPVVSGLTSIAIYPFVGSVTFQHQIEVKLTNTTSCDIKSVDVTLTGIPATVPLTFKCTFDKCTPAGRIFTYLWTTYASDPTGVSYAISCDFKDSDDISITSFVPAYSPIAFP